MVIFNGKLHYKLVIFHGFNVKLPEGIWKYLEEQGVPVIQKCLEAGTPVDVVGRMLQSIRKCLR